MTEITLSFGMMKDIPDDVIKSIMTFAHFGVGSMEIESPASRFAHVSKTWNRLYQEATNESSFETKELRRITQGMTIRTCPRTTTGAGGVETILDCWEKVKGVPPWWTSSYVFEGGFWDDKNALSSDFLYDVLTGHDTHGPFYIAEGRTPPTLMINFDRPITIRAVCFWARNKPRLVYCFKEGLPGSTPFHLPLHFGSPKNTLHIPKAPFKKKVFGKSDPLAYAKVVGQAMPQGRTAPAYYLEQFDLPTILPEPITVNVGESFGIRILASQERGWVGINNLLIFE